jgi:hypothetical protein
MSEESAMKRRILARTAVTMLVVATCTGSGCSYYSGGPGPEGPPPGYQPRMQNALSALQEAREQLVAAAPDKGGHRVAAINLVDQAINQVQMGMQVAGE